MHSVTFKFRQAWIPAAETHFNTLILIWRTFKSFVVVFCLVLSPQKIQGMCDRLQNSPFKRGNVATKKYSIQFYRVRKMRQNIHYKQYLPISTKKMYLPSQGKKKWGHIYSVTCLTYWASAVAPCK